MGCLGVVGTCGVHVAGETLMGSAGKMVGGGIIPSVCWLCPSQN